MYLQTKNHIFHARLINIDRPRLLLINQHSVQASSILFDNLILHQSLIAYNNSL